MRREGHSRTMATPRRGRKRTPCPDGEEILERPRGSTYAARADQLRHAAQKRRGREADVFAAITDALPVEQPVKDRINKGALLKLAIHYIQTRKLMPTVPPGGEAPSGSSTGLEEGALVAETERGFLLLLNQQGCISYASERVLQFLGYDWVDMVGTPILDYVHALDRDVVRALLHSQRTSMRQRYLVDNMPKVRLGLHRTVEVRMRRQKDRSDNTKFKHVPYVALEWRCRPLVEDGGSVAGLSVLCCPLERTPVAEIRLGATMFITRHKLDRTCTFIDPRVTWLVGYEPGDFLGGQMINYHNPEDENDRVGCMNTLLTEGTAVSRMFRFCARDGSQPWMQIRAMLVRDERTGKPAYYICMHYLVNQEEGRRYHAQQQARASTNHEDVVYDPDVMGPPDHTNTQFSNSSSSTSQSGNLANNSSVSCRQNPRRPTPELTEPGDPEVLTPVSPGTPANPTVVDVVPKEEALWNSGQLVCSQSGTDSHQPGTTPLQDLVLASPDIADVHYVQGILGAVEGPEGRLHPTCVTPEQGPQIQDYLSDSEEHTRISNVPYDRVYPSPGEQATYWGDPPFTHQLSGTSSPRSDTSECSNTDYGCTRNSHNGDAFSSGTGSDVPSWQSRSPDMFVESVLNILESSSAKRSRVSENSDATVYGWSPKWADSESISSLDGDSGYCTTPTRSPCGNIPSSSSEPVSYMNYPLMSDGCSNSITSLIEDPAGIAVDGAGMSLTATFPSLASSQSDMPVLAAPYTTNMAFGSSVRLASMNSMSSATTVQVAALSPPAQVTPNLDQDTYYSSNYSDLNPTCTLPQTLYTEDSSINSFQSVSLTFPQGDLEVVNSGLAVMALPLGGATSCTSPAMAIPASGSLSGDTGSGHSSLSSSPELQSLIDVYLTEIC